MTLTHAASVHLRAVFDDVRSQFRSSDAAGVRVVADYASLEQAREAMDFLFERMRVGTYRSLLRPVACTSLGELRVEVSVS